MIEFKITDNLSPFINKLIKTNPNLLNECLGKAGMKIRSKMQNKARSYGRAKTGGWTFNPINRKRRLISTKEAKSDPSQKLFKRYSHTTGEELKADMADMLKSRVYEESHKVIVGFIDTKSYTPTLYQNGRVVGKAKRVSGTYSKEFGQRYENGGFVSLSEKQKKFFQASGWLDAMKAGGVVKKAHPLLPAGASSMSAAALDFERHFLKVLNDYK